MFVVESGESRHYAMESRVTVDDHLYIDDDRSLSAFVERAMEVDRYAIDTEFHRERSYFPKVALIQINTGRELALIDPIAVEPSPIAKLFGTDAVAVLHAGSQDLEVFEHWAGTLPRTIFDTQLAAGFTGMSTPSLAALHDKVLRISLPKSSRLTDWLRRPLSDAQLSYAASDVAHLLELQTRLVAELRELGRLEWAEAEFELLRTQPRGRRDPEEAWRRIKAVRQLKGSSLGAARLIAAWREQYAAEVDQPVRFILSDLALVGISQRMPTTSDELRSVRGVDDRFARGDQGAVILEMVRRGGEMPEPTSNRSSQRTSKQDLRPAVALVAAWVAQLSSEVRIDPALLGTRADIEALVRGDEGARLSLGWRAQLAGEPIRRLMSGEAAVAFDGSNGLVLEERSHRAVARPGA